MTKRPAFSQVARDTQLRWALEGALPVQSLERQRNGEPKWVLEHKDKFMNLFRPEWWSFIRDAEHRWARALNSSQCFAVNLFAPLAEDSDLARQVISKLLPVRTFDGELRVLFEYTPQGTRKWLGESDHPTQIDVFLEIEADSVAGFVLIEVKYSEKSFGTCRGWTGKKDGEWSNPDRDRCLDVSTILEAPEARCWLTETQGRRYWESISKPDSSISLESTRRAGPCPFRYGLYQLMRNRVLADELVRHNPGAWAEFATCGHQDNLDVLRLGDAVLGHWDAIPAFRAISSQGALHQWDAEDIVNRTLAEKPNLQDWAHWMRQRYFPQNT